MDPASAWSEQHRRLVEGAERLHALAEMADAETSFALRVGLAEEMAFIELELLPHMDGVERALYGRLEELFEGHHSLAPMREEHRQLRELVLALEDHRSAVEAGRLDRAGAMVLRRLLYRLHSMLRVHLAEELVYRRALEGRLDATERSELERAIAAASRRSL